MNVRVLISFILVAALTSRTEADTTTAAASTTTTTTAASTTNTATTTAAAASTTNTAAATAAASTTTTTTAASTTNTATTTAAAASTTNTAAATTAAASTTTTTTAASTTNTATTTAAAAASTTNTATTTASTTNTATTPAAASPFNTATTTAAAANTTNTAAATTAAASTTTTTTAASTTNTATTTAAAAASTTNTATTTASTTNTATTPAAASPFNTATTTAAAAASPFNTATTTAAAASTTNTAAATTAAASTTTTTTAASTTNTATTTAAAAASTTNTATTTASTTNTATTPAAASPFNTATTTAAAAAASTITAATPTIANTATSAAATPITTINTANSTPAANSTTVATPPDANTTASPTGPEACENGGVLLSGVCLCPDEWTGDTCSVEYFCRAKQLAGFRFPRSPFGWFSYSEEVCDPGTNGADKPRAATRCSTINGSVEFEYPQFLQCDQTLSEILQDLNDAANFETLASSAQILTSRPEELTPDDVTAAAQIANRLLGSANATESVRVAAVATISQLLNANALDATEENNATLELTKTLDTMSVTFSSNLKTSGSQVVQPNLVIQSVQVPAADTQGVQFTSLTGTSGSFVANRIQVDTNSSTVAEKNGSIADALIRIQFTPEAVPRHQEPADVSLGFVLYQNDRLFRSKFHRGRRATVRVLSATVRGPSVRKSRVEMLFRPTLDSRMLLFDFSCVFYDYNVDDWSVAGCSKGTSSDGVLRCACNHTTNFAALFSVRPTFDYALVLDWISVLGLSLSVLGLVITIFHHTIHKDYWDNHRTVTFTLLCICSSLLFFIITFIFGVVPSSRAYDEPPPESDRNVLLDSDQRVEPDGGTCTAVTALLHFFLLSTFMWISMLCSFTVLVEGGYTLPLHWTAISVVIGWGFPGVLMAMTLVATYRVDDPLGYRQEEFCWLAALDSDKRFDFSQPMFWGFVLPVALTLVYNLVLQVVVLWRKKTSFSWTELMSSVLAVLVSLSWSLGYAVLATTGHAHMVFSILFCLLTTTQGFLIFILFTARHPQFKADVLQFIRYFTLSDIPRVTFSRINVSNINIPHVTLSSFSLSRTNIPLVTVPRPRHMSYKLQTTLVETSSTETYRELRDEDTPITTRL